MTDPLAQQIARQVERLRLSHAHAPALDVLDLVMRGHEGQALAFGDSGWPPSELALTVAEALDPVNSRADWYAWTRPGGDAQARAAALAIWAIQVWPLFCQRYRLMP